jgi:hypothetical protein
VHRRPGAFLLAAPSSFSLSSFSLAAPSSFFSHTVRFPQEAVPFFFSPEVPSLVHLCPVD